MNKKDRDALRTKADELQAAYRAMDSGVYGSSEFAAWKAAYQTAEEARKNAGRPGASRPTRPA